MVLLAGRLIRVRASTERMITEAEDASREREAVETALGAAIAHERGAGRRAVAALEADVHGWARGFVRRTGLSKVPVGPVYRI